MKKWAAHAPENFLHKWHLVEAELAREKQNDTYAIRNYRKAVRLAQKNQYLQEEALSNELAAKYYSDKKESKIARPHNCSLTAMIKADI